MATAAAPAALALRCCALLKEGFLCPLAFGVMEVVVLGKLLAKVLVSVGLQVMVPGDFCHLQRVSAYKCLTSAVLQSCLLADTLDHRCSSPKHSPRICCGCAALSCCALQPSITIPQSQIYLARPGSMVPVQALINGAAARSNCSSSTSTVPSTATPPSPAPDASEATSLAAAGPACGYFPSSYLTPTVISFAVSAAPDSGSPSVLTLTGALLTNQAGDVTVTVGGEQCSITEAAANGSNVSCTLPALPAGDADVMLVIAGAGYAAMPGGSNTVRITTPLVTRSLTPARGSYHGGVVLSVAGSGFAKLPSNSSMQMEVTVFGLAPGPIAPALASATNTLAAIRLPYYKAAVSAATRQLTLQLRVFDRASNATVATATLPYVLDTAYTPSVTRVTPATLEPFTPANITLSWSVGAPAAAGAVGVNDSLPAGTASVARVFLQGRATGRAYECGLVAGEGATPQVVITTSNLNSTAGSYQEAIACQLPATLPAAVYDVWVCLEGVGCGFAAAAVRVPVNVSSISGSAGSIAGGAELVITGTGETASFWYAARRLRMVTAT